MATRRRCCGCHKNRVCRWCFCVKNNLKCVSCAPKESGKCQNLTSSQASQSQPRAGFSLPDRHGLDPVASVTSSPQSEALGTTVSTPTSSSADLAIRNPSSASSLPSVAGAVSPSSSALSASNSVSLPPSSSLSVSCPSVINLPSYQPVSTANFAWNSDVPARECIDAINYCYEKAVHWIPNLFSLPSGKQGRLFVKELSRLFYLYTESSAMECIALKAAFLLPLLVLQKPHKRSKLREHCKDLERRLVLWKDGRFRELLKEGNTIQRKFKYNRCNMRKSDPLRLFTRFMFHGKVRSALRVLNENGSMTGQPLSLSSPLSKQDPSLGTVRDAVFNKHPDPAPVSPSHCLLNSTPPPDHDPHSVIFQQIDGVLIRRTIMSMDGAAGPSGLDVSFWKKMCSSFKRESDELCNSVACVARKMCSQYVDPSGLEALLASRLIALDKNPGVRPIGIGEVCRRLIGKAALLILKDDVIEVTGSRQLCAGQKSACESIVHCVRELFDGDETEGLLCVDASNAFNSLNRGLALRNILHLCPSFGRLLINTYRLNNHLFIDGECIGSKEGTTQGDPLAMSMYAVASVPLIDELDGVASVSQFWYADDASALGKLDQLRRWWDGINTIGKHYGYSPNASKSVLLVKEDCYERACSVFEGSNVIVKTDGVRLLGSPVGSKSFVNQFIKETVDKWLVDLGVLCTFAESQPQAAYAAFSHGLFSRWTYFFRSCDVSPDHLTRLEELIRLKLIPALSGKDAINDLERNWLALPIRCGGMGLFNPSAFARSQYRASRDITQPLVDCLLSGSKGIPFEVFESQCKVIEEYVKKKRNDLKVEKQKVRDCLSSDKQRLFDVACERGASVWLSALPLSDHGFDLNKGSFRDSICIRYGWQLQDLPSSCVCDSSFTVDHALSCPMGGYPTLRHNELRDLTASC